MRRTFGAFFVSVSLLAGCSSGESAPASTVSQPEGELDQTIDEENTDGKMLDKCGIGLPVIDRSVRIVTSIEPVTNLVSAFVSGSGLKVEGLVPQGANSAGYEPTAQDRERLIAADIVFTAGLGLDQGVIEAAETLVDDASILCELGTASMPANAYIYDEYFLQENNSPNPYVWPVPSVALRMLNAVRKAIEARSSTYPDVLDENYVSISRQIMEVEAAMKAATMTVPVRNRKVVTADPSLAYFARHFGYEFVSVPFADGGSLSGDSTEEFVAAVKLEDVPAVFGSWDLSADLTRRLMDDAGATWVKTDEFVVLPGTRGTAQHSWAGAVIGASVKIVESLGGDASALKAVDRDIGLADTAVYPPG